MTTLKFSSYAGVAATSVGFVVLILNWNLFDYFGGPLPGYNFFLFPGNLSLVYVWHPLFTEEVDLIPKMGLILLGQFTIVGTLTAVVHSIFKGHR